MGFSKFLMWLVCMSGGGWLLMSCAFSQSSLPEDPYDGLLIENDIKPDSE